MVLIIPAQGKLAGQAAVGMELKAPVLELSAKVTQAAQHIGPVVALVVQVAVAVLVQ